MAPKKKGGKAPPKKETAKAPAGDDWEAALEEFGVAPKEDPKPPAPAQTAPKPAETAAQAESDDEGEQAGGVDAAAEYLAKMGIAPGGEEDKKKKDKKKKKKTKPEKKEEKEEKKPLSAAAKLLLERQQALKEEEERRRKEQEEEERRIQEEERERQLEEQKKKELAEKKKEAKRLKKEQQKKEGTYMTKSQKEKAARAKAALEMMQAAGLTVGPGAEEGEKKKKKVVYDNRKKKGAKKKEEEVASPPLEEVTKEEVEPSPVEESPQVEDAWDAEDKVEEKPAEEEEDVADDWDEADWESADLTVKVKSQEEEEEEDLLLQEKKEEEERLRKLHEERKKREQEEAEKRAQRQADESDEGEDGIMRAGGGRRKNLSREAMEKKKAAHERRKARETQALESRSEDKLRSPICCIMGHVDTGKTKLLDNIRKTNVQDAEAGGITQQIGATFFPVEAIKTKTEKVNMDAFFNLEYKLPGLLIIDTPGHESFTNLRSRGSSLCDIAILVVDIMHGLEPQTLESLGLLKRKKTPFIVALNKVDRCYGWKAVPNRPIREALAAQDEHVQSEFKDRTTQIITAFAEQGLNARLYWENDDLRRQASIIPTSAISGEGVPDLQMMLVKLTQEMMARSLMYLDTVQCTILEVKVIEGLGTTIDTILVNGSLKEGDTIVVCTLDGPVVTTIRSLLTPQPMREMRVKGDYIHHPRIEAAIGVKICAQGIERAVAGTAVMVVGPDDDVEDIKEEVMSDLNTILDKIGQTKRGVYVQSSTLGALEALLEFLRSCDPPIPVAGVNIGPIHKKDIMRAAVQLEHGKKEHATVLAFDVKVTPEARELADDMGIRIFTADIIYHLFDQFTAYINDLQQARREETAGVAVFPCIVKILPQFVFNKKGPIIVGVDVVEGILKVGTPLCVPQLDMLSVGRVSSIENNHKEVPTARKGSSVAIKIDAPEDNPNITFGRQFDEKFPLYSKISRESIDVLKENFRNDLTKEDWMLVVKMKPVFGIK